MSGSMKTVLIYGFYEGNREFILDANWLRNNFDEIECFALDVVRNHLGEAAYGVRADLDSKTGVASISEEKKSKMKDLYYRWLESKGIKHEADQDPKESKEGDENNSEEESETEIGHLGFYYVISGDAYNIYEHEHYKLTAANKKVVTKHRSERSRHDQSPMEILMECSVVNGNPILAMLLKKGLRDLA